MADENGSAMVTTEPTDVATQEPQSILAVIARAAADPRVDVQKMQALLNMQLKVETRQAEVEFNAALARLMPKLPRIEKNGAIYGRDGKLRSRYAYYEDVDAATRPILAEEGFSISFDTDNTIPKVLLVTGTLAHRMGHSQQSRLAVPTENAVITGAQAIGAAVSFAKRYIVINMLNIVTVGIDTDGEQPKVISEEQVLTLETLLQDTKSDRAKFLAWAQVSKLEDILEKDLAAAIRALAAKRRQ